MERYGRLTAILAVVLLHQFAISTSRAQPPASPAPSIPPPRPVASAERPAQPVGDPLVKLKPSPLEPTDLRFPINLATALRLSDARPLMVAAAQASVWVAEAQLTRAKVLWVPQLNVGADYHSARRRRTGFQQGPLDRAQREFSLCRCRSVADRRLDRCHFRAPGGAADVKFAAL